MFVYKPEITTNFKIHVNVIRRKLLVASELVVYQFRLCVCTHNFVRFVL
jgi:hypothetical protein